MSPWLFNKRVNHTIIGPGVVIGVILHFCEAGIPNFPNILMKTIHHSRTVFENPTSTVQVYRNKTGQKSPLLVKTYHMLMKICCDVKFTIISGGPRFLNNVCLKCIRVKKCSTRVTATFVISSVVCLVFLKIELTNKSWETNKGYRSWAYRVFRKVLEYEPAHLNNKHIQTNVFLATSLFFQNKFSLMNSLTKYTEITEVYFKTNNKFVLAVILKFS